MPTNPEQLYQQRLKRYLTAMANGKPDRVPIRPFVAEFTAKYAGYDCQQVAHDYNKAFDAALKCAADFDWDAIVPNMVYVWTGLTQAIGLRYYGIPGIHIPADTGFQYREPPEDQAFMRADEYDRFIANPVEFLYNVWLPRVSEDVAPIGSPSTYRNNLSFVKGGMGMMQYFGAFGPQIAAMREQSGTVSAIAGILKAPMDILADKFRGYIGLCEDLIERPEKVRAACDALAPHLLHIAMSGADPAGQVPVSMWMHRSCVPFISHKHFEEIHWPTLKPIIEGLWAAGHQTLFYAEGKWCPHLDSFAELPAGSHRLPLRPGRHLRGAQEDRQAVRPQRWRAEFPAGLPQRTGGQGLLQEDHRRGGPRRRIHHGRQRHRAERRQDREHPRHDGVRSRVRRVRRGEPFRRPGP